MRDIKALHAKLCPKKFLGNFWKSVDYKAADAMLEELEVPPHQRRFVTAPSRGKPSRTTVHPVIALAFLRWANPVLFYARLHRIIIT